ncbi:Sterol desaturase/sphingolipid hydroxylase, fatty acid hydroxylase superfamily [Mucilaginibacter pineti]|uniref:Sterol desaturase/sphingolipid hydroxylase, fatty acid hydroxylase superfamily n=1 Tax=Mucilaginibacter pineti TaxID=1391627 RepID=A0A1G7C3L6_9SPHI|nr:sterol desaturase family protein [Mucilaginibacter pineti]SDE33025.1 Sterol desaturase/sphingolipid hydroxylase, fatty acid hydroxylase superfamily [Mucilaginibacter pineti]
MEKALHVFVTIFSISAVRYFVIAGVPFIVFYKILNTWFGKSKIQSRLATKSDFFREVVLSMQTTIVLTILAYVVLYTPFKNYTRIYTNINDYPMWYIGVSILIALVIHDTYFYWMHRLLHVKRVFPYTHLLHHKSVSPSPWASYSFHFIEAWTEGLVLFVIVMIVPMHQIGIVLFTIIAFMINVYGHLGYEVAPKRFRHSFLFQILNSSVYHNLHHSKFKGNYGLYFRIWDRLMGTENPDYVKEYDRIQAQRFGAEDVPANNNVKEHFV